MSAIRGGEIFPRAGVSEAVDVSRRPLLVLVLLVCVPVPLLTLGGLAVPFPEVAQRALAPLLPFVQVPGAERSAASANATSALTIVPTRSEIARGRDVAGSTGPRTNSGTPSERSAEVLAMVTGSRSGAAGATVD